MRIFLIIIFGTLPFWVFGDYRIEGKINLSNEWERTIYLSVINAFDDLNAVSEDFILNSTPVQDNGDFVLTGDNLPAEERLFRLHVCKKGDPAATIIIGGKDENHLHFVMHQNAKLKFLPATNGRFSDAEIKGYSPNMALSNLEGIIKNWKNRGKAISQISREYDFVAYQNDLRNFADSCQNALISLMAIHYLDLETDYFSNQSFYNSFYEKRKNENDESIYFKAFEQQLVFLEFQQKKEPNRIFPKWLIPTILAAFIFGLLFLIRKREAANKNNLPKKIDKLSIQERRVFQFLIEGKSNKEISSALNIGLSTVKSHVHSIYAKLNIRSRKEVLSRFG